MPGTSLDKLERKENQLNSAKNTYHIGGTQYLLIGLNVGEKTAASQRGVPGKLRNQYWLRKPDNEYLPKNDTKSDLQTPVVGVINVSDFIQKIWPIYARPKQLPE